VGTDANALIPGFFLPARPSFVKELLFLELRARAVRMCFRNNHLNFGDISMKGILLWIVGIPIPIIILLYLFNVL